jgi:hypothetical protein
MIDFLLSLFLLFNLQFGHAAYYADGAMEQVVRIRQAGWTAGDLPTDLPPVVGFVAVSD